MDHPNMHESLITKKLNGFFLEKKIFWLPVPLHWIMMKKQMGMFLFPAQICPCAYVCMFVCVSLQHTTSGWESMGSLPVSHCFFMFLAKYWIVHVVVIIIFFIMRCLLAFLCIFSFSHTFYPIHPCLRLTLFIWLCRGWFVSSPYTHSPRWKENLI